MVQYLLEKRVRHLHSVSLYNVSMLGNEASLNSDENKLNVFKKISCFVVIDNLNGAPLYVSEVQVNTFNKLSFNEMPPNELSDSTISLRIVGKIPNDILIKSEANTDEIWIVFKEIGIQFDKLKRIRRDTIFEGVNIPILEFNDGLYTLENINAISNVPDVINFQNSTSSEHTMKESFSFNSLLEFNKVIEYKSHILEEILHISSEVQHIMEHRNKERGWEIIRLNNSIEQMKLQLNNKRIDLKNVEVALANSSDISQLSSQLISRNSSDASIADNYGNKNYRVIHSNNQLDVLKVKKLKQLISIFRNYPLFDEENGYVEIATDFDSKRPSTKLLKFKLVNKSKILSSVTDSEVKRIDINTILGQYMLFLQIISTIIYNIPLPYEMRYYGSTSIISYDLPLFISETVASKYRSGLLQAIEMFNLNIKQVKVYIERKSDT